MNYSKEVEEVIKLSKGIAIIIQSNTIRPEHLFLAMIDEEYSEASNIMRDLNLNINAIKSTIRDWSKDLQKQNGLNSLRKNASIPLELETEKILKESVVFAKSMDSDEVCIEHVFYAILDNNNNLVSDLFNKSPEILRSLKNKLKNEEDELNINDELENSNMDEEQEQEVKGKSKSKTKLIDQFGTNLTNLAKEGKLDPVVGRADEIKRISQILSRRKKNNPVLVGEPGVGKSAIVEGLAQLIVDGLVPENLQDKKIITLDMGSLVAGTKYRGEFEQRLRGIVKEMEENPDIILFIDEIHTIIGAGSAQGSLDASNMLKPGLARGTFRCIGATTLEEYRKYVEKDAALERRFQKVVVEATSKSETLEILKNIKKQYEDHHKVTYTDDALEACVNLSGKYISEKFFPDKAIDVLDEAGAMVHVNGTSAIPVKIVELSKKIKISIVEKLDCISNQKYEIAAEHRDNEKQWKSELETEKETWSQSHSDNRPLVTQQDIAEVVALITKIPVDNVSVDENNKLKYMANKVKTIVIGQDEAVDKIVQSVKRSRVGINSHDKPVGTFIFSGPTGVGKTYLAKIMAKELFGSEDAMIRIDMSEFMEKFSVSRLVGAPPGYVGYEDGGKLTEAVRRKPYSIILLDEIEKAHPDVQNILLQVLDDGVLTDSNGRKVDFKNTIIVMTTNAGSRKLKDFGTGIGFGLNKNNQDSKNSVLKKELEKVFSPEFLNRVDEVINFNSLSKENICSIVDVECKSLISNLKEKGYDVIISQSLKDYLFENGYDENYGARPLKRVIQSNIEDKLTDAIIDQEISVGDTLSLIYDKESSSVKIFKISNNEIKNGNILTENTKV